MTFGNDFMEWSEQRFLESDGKGEEVGFACLLARVRNLDLSRFMCFLFFLSFSFIPKMFIYFLWRKILVSSFA